MENKRKDTKSGKQKILLVDDYLGLRRALTQLINRESDLEVCAVAGNIGQALSTIANRPFDLAIVDLVYSCELQGGQLAYANVLHVPLRRQGTG